MRQEIKWFVMPQRGLHSMPTGWGNGYAAVPEGHPLHGVGYYDANIDAHGGLTFAEAADTLEDWLPVDLVESLRGHWIFGFDTAHWGDTLERWPKEAVEAETKRIVDQLQALWQ